MAGYHRFISYIYLYEQGNKTMNTGFAKVESRNGQCRITISMKNMYHKSDVRFLAYMFVRREGRLMGIYLGNLVTQNNTGELDAVTDSENIEGSGYTLEDVKGMIIRGDNGKIYGTGWDDEALNVDTFAPLGEEPAEAYRDEPEKEAEAAQTGRTLFSAEDIEMSAAAPVLTEKEEVRITPALAEEEESAPASEGEGASGQVSAEGGESRERPQQKTAFDAFRHFGDSDLPEKLDSTVPIEAAEFSNGEMAETATVPPETEAGAEVQPSAETGVENGGNEEVGGSQSPMEKIMDQGMRMFPFDDDQITACVRMEPQDIGMLPMKYWRLAGNSFLLHGYYSYRHLIMARRNDGTFIFGIPGVDYERERFMARMFGFNQFKPVRASAIGPGQFGYWYMELA